MENKIIIIDIETTGFLNSGGKIVELGIVELDLLTGETKIVFDEVTHETGITLDEITDSWIVKNSDLDVEQVRHSRNIKTIQPEVQKIINSYTLGATAYNNEFDFGFLENRGFTFPKKLACPMKLATNVCKIPGKYGKYKWPNVEECYYFLFGKTDYIEKHRGADDALHEAKIVFELYKQKVFTV